MGKNFLKDFREEVKFKDYCPFYLNGMNAFIFF